MTALTEKLLQRIHVEGPVSIATFMNECLLHPQFGYYTTRDPFGADGDFVTAPEISQMFGEMIGLCLAQTWLEQGAPKEALLVEVGPGKGTLMADALRAIKAVPEFQPDVCLVEASPKLRQVQQETLSGTALTWCETVADLPEGRPIFLVANEFFDALPIRQYQRAETGWEEILVGAHDGALQFVRAASGLPTALATRADVPVGGRVEISPQLPTHVEEITRRIVKNGGMALVLDYGDWRSNGDTLQAVKDHKPEPVFANPGLADVTAHVDFEALAIAAQAVGGQVSEMVPQGVFLERLGITQRAQNLAQVLANKGDQEAFDTLVAAHRRLTHPEEMGLLFKTLAIFPQGKSQPVGVRDDT